METPPDPVLRLRREGMDWRLVEGEIVILDLKASEYLGSNPAGTLLWTRLAEGTTEQALVVALLERYEVPEDEAAADVRDFLRALEKQELIESGPQPSSAQEPAPGC